MYRIGIVDDEKDERDDIQVSILDNAGWILDKPEIEFKEYELEGRERESILQEIQNDIDEKNIQALIVDFRLDTTADVIKGWQIIEFMHDEIPEFPVIIMTNAPEESKQSEHTDADKVYPKKIFLNPELEETKELVTNIILNMQKYVTRRESLEEKLAIELQKLDKNSEDEKTLEQIMEIETELGRYKQLYQTTVDTSLDMDELKDIFQQLKRYEELLG